MKKLLSILSLSAVLLLQVNCSSSDNGGDPTDPTTPTNPTNPGVNEVDFYMTTGNRSAELALQNTILDFGTTANSYNTIEVDESTSYQTIDGFGYTLTGGSVQVINTLNDSKRQELLNELFSTNGIGISYLRVSIGASDLNATPFTYDDIATGQTDTSLSNFSVAADSALIQMLKDILAINPNIKIVATPWTAPVWMKSNGSFVGGSLKPEYYATYAQYFVKYIQAMQSEGISITAVTPQNEPLNPYNNPSMLMQSNEQATFIGNNLGPAFQAAGITTKIIVYDHNCDVTSYPINIYNNAAANQYVDGAAFHLYAGDINALTAVHNAQPSKNIYFTEQYTAAAGDFAGDLKWHLKNVVIGSMRNWSKNALEWNLAANSAHDPHTNGGCDDCKGAITVTTSSNYSRNVAYYIIAHASKFVPAGSVRINSNVIAGLNNVAFKTPAGKVVLIVENDNNFNLTFNIKHNGEWVATTLPAGAVGSYVWE
jgi:glucosylceramidase